MAQVKVYGFCFLAFPVGVAFTLIMEWIGWSGLYHAVRSDRETRDASNSELLLQSESDAMPDVDEAPDSHLVEDAVGNDSATLLRRISV